MNITAEIKYTKALTEVFYILNTLTDELRRMIPNDFINLVKDNMDKEYFIDKNIIEQKGLSIEAQAILALIYRDFLCDDETRDEYLKIDKQVLKNEAKKYEEIFNNKENVQELEVKQNIEKNVRKKELIVYEKENFFKRIINKARKLLSRNR